MIVERIIAARNSDGQLTRQHGIHARFETALFERFRARLKVSPCSLVTVHDDEYFALMLSRVQPILEQRLAESVVDTASMIAAAWIAAGRPALPLETPQIPRKIGGQ